MGMLSVFMWLLFVYIWTQCVDFVSIFAYICFFFVVTDMIEEAFKNIYRYIASYEENPGK